jgi:hypothetical protein
MQKKLTRDPSDERARLMVNNLRGMMHGLLCGRCVLEARVDLTRMPVDWQAITIIDGTALCVEHVLAKARDDAQRRTGQKEDEQRGHDDEAPRWSDGGN